jgi:ubiquinone/menaquinone biosynthesis C-methylase UbiE
MTIVRDPQGTETHYLHQLGRLEGARVLEVGCGEGRLTWRYAQAARSIVAIDPNRERLVAAPQACPPEWRERVHFVQADAERPALRHGEFDRAILAWTL